MRILSTSMIMTCLLAWAVASQLGAAVSWGHDSYQLSEWLINYAGGFVRRGLPGEILWRLSSASGLQANHLALTASTACFLGLTVWLLMRARALFPASLILSCVVMGFPAYQESILRKDCMGLLLMLACLKVDASGLDSRLRFILINLQAGIAILCHESFVFYALPALVLHPARESAAAGFLEISRRCLMLLPCMACLALATLHHGSPETAAKVNASWLPLWQVTDPGNPAVLQPDASIEALGWTAAQGMHLPLHMLTSGFYQPMAWIMVFGLAGFLMVALTGKRGDESARRSARVRTATVLALQLACISPLFLLGVDYGRWLFLWSASSMMILILRPATPAWALRPVARLFAWPAMGHAFGRIPVREWYLLFFGVPVCWSMRNFLAASPLGHSIGHLWSSF